MSSANDKEANRLSLADWANIAEVIGGVAVVISLVYVGVQINLNTAEIRSTNRQQLVSRAGDATTHAASNPELAGALAKAAAGEALSARELSQYRYFVRGMLYDVQEAYLLYQEGRLNEAYWLTRAAIFRAYVDNPAAESVFARDSQLGVLHADFVEWANHEIGD